jgi:hypothetical protein
MSPYSVRIASRTLTLIGILCMLGMAFGVGSLDSMTYIFIASCFILVGTFLPSIFKKTEEDD